MQSSTTRREFLSRCAMVCTGSTLLGLSAFWGSAGAVSLKRGLIGKKLSPYFTSLGNQIIRCDLCPRECEVAPGDRGYCEVRENMGGKYYSLVYGNPCAVHIDPIEKKPFYHVLPSSRSFSLATAGCNFDCKFCQNWEISQARPDDTYNYQLSPEQVVASALQYRCESIASTYVEPTIFAEYMIDIGRLIKQQPLLKVMHSNGFINEKPLDDLCEVLDAACIDLKGFTEEYYESITEGSLEPVLNTIKRLVAKGIHTELVTLLVPGKNDDMELIRAMCQWVRKELGEDVPIHFTRFYPRYKLKSIPPTPVSTLEKACSVALEEGLNYAYIGNVADHPAGHTYCPHCKKMLIRRIGYRVKVLELNNGKCKNCGRPIAGIWNLAEARPQRFSG
ncbi:MAG: AmmeMemoRadiSam system radical SAM enzyme [Deltaproteobacteria bacterium]|nr:AmmeMemoRadiSam system radical SAM enzyme [Deltaproteobacteria bacterium]MBW1962005.1 AmmeMemoRadiSam system radical SAM enzyme [Deltaproteobacteria bacterium]MBW2151314.1 AmmeMemoRadiSam system radical SAM enzyme [Deltaproteobacteria bacterium]